MNSFDRRRVLRLGGGFGALALLAGCDTTGLGFASLADVTAQMGMGSSNAAGKSFGTGPVKVFLLLPLSGDASLSRIGISMANAAQLAMDYVTGTAKIGDNITLSILDTGATPEGATGAAKAAVAGGAKLILGPLRGDQVEAAGAVAKAANIPVIGFSNNPSAAAPGVYLLSVLPDAEIHRSLGYAIAQRHTSLAAVFPSTDFGRAQRMAFDTVSANLGVKARQSFSFADANDQRRIATEVGGHVSVGNMDAIFLPDRVSAPAFASLLQRVIPAGKALIIGSADWDNDPAILSSSFLAGAVYPAVDDSGLKALEPDYNAKFGGKPHPLATIAYTAVVLANAKPLALGHPPYGAGLLTSPGGFSGRDGVFRFLPDGRSEYALVIKKVAPGGAVVVDGARL
ncbi:MAG TPA: penicillin-binding protein activator [Devosia sp.]|nr:penicillin-binding protein activator [Devosia sp.]